MSEDIVVENNSDLVISKTVDQTTPAEGDTILYTITVTNNGPAQATNVSIDDVLPAGVTATGTNTPSQGSYDGTTWTIGTINNTANATLTIEATVDVGTGGTVITNTVTNISLDQVDSNITADDLSEDITVENNSDLVISKTVNDSTPAEGDTILYTITVTNNGPALATNVSVDDVLPTGVTATGTNTPSQGSYDGTTWTIGTINNGNNATLTIEATVDVGTSDDTITNTVTNITLDQVDSNITADDLSEDIIVENESDLVISKTVDNSTPFVGETIVYTITLLNNGPAQVTNLSVDDVLPAGVTATGTNTTTQGSYDGTTWTVGTIDSGNGATLTIEATVDLNVGGTMITNTVTNIVLDQIDSDVTPDDLDETIDAIAVSDIEITKAITSTSASGNNATPFVGENITFQLTVTNVGPSIATNVVLNDQLPSGYTYVSDTSGGSYNPATGDWTLPTIAVGVTETIEITALVLAAGNYDNYAEITASDNEDFDSNPDPTPDTDTPVEDDEAFVEVNPVPVSDIEITKSITSTSASGNNATPFVGENITFQLTVTNVGPSIATNVVLNDQLPSGYTYGSDTSGGAYNPATGDWTLPTIAIGATETIEITALVLATGDYDNYAEITASDNQDLDSNPDPTPDRDAPVEDDEAFVMVEPIAVSDIEITKSISSTSASGDNSTPYVGENITFELTVTNVGPSIATNVVLNDQLPSGYTYISDTSGGAYNPATGDWTLPTIAIGATETIEVTALVLATGNYDNYAEITASDNVDLDSNPDPTPDTDAPVEDDEAFVAVDPIPVSDVELTKTVDNLTPFVGTNVVFTLVVTNNGPSEATGVEVTDLLPAGYTYVSDDSGGAYVAGTGIWTVPNIPIGTTQTINITAFVLANGVAADYDNFAEVTASDNIDFDSDPAVSFGTDDIGDGLADDDEDFVEVRPIPVSDLSIEKTINIADPITGVSNPTTGDIITFIVTVTNDGPSDVTGVAVEDVIPDGFGNITNISNGGVLTGNTITWTGLSIANANNIPLTFDAEVLTTGTNTTTSYYNQAEITASDNIDFDSDFNESFGVDDGGDGIADDDESIADNIIVNFLPTAFDDDVFVVENSSDNPIAVLDDNGNGADDFGRDGPSSNTIVITTPPANGTAVVNDNGTPTDPTDDFVEYTPNPDFVGFDTLIYRIEDGQGLIGTTVGDYSFATLTIEVLVDTDGDGIPDRFDIDDDNDGITDIVESNGMNPDGDDDSDGIPNFEDPDFCSVALNASGTCPDFDFDGDGIPNHLDIDADGDGIPDNVEAQPTEGYVAPSSVDANNNGLDDIYETAQGGTDISPENSDGADNPDYLDLDSDNDNVPDSIEAHDANSNGMIDVGEATSLGLDTDLDGLDDGYEGADVDDDFDVNDDIDNPTLDLTDTDGDATDADTTSGDVDYRDTDDDGDGINTVDEDVDGSGDPFDDDSDGDGQPDYLDIDDDGDGILTSLETDDDLDNDGNPNYLDIDADGDGLPDNVEAQPTDGYIEPSGIDADNDGLDDAYDTVVTGNPGSNGLNPVNTDGQDDPDYLDEDSDNDGVLDAIEGHDADFNGIPDVESIGVDTDGDGLDDGFEGADLNDPFDVNDEINDPRSDLPDFDATGDLTVDDDVNYRDTDDDNDGTPTLEEDSNLNGDWSDDDCDFDSFPDYLDVTPCDRIPSGFSPNDDGNNDEFIIPLVSKFPNFRLEVYDRWGTRVFDYSNNNRPVPQWWDGFSRGRLTIKKDVKVPVGTYYYILYLNKDNEKPRTGWIYVNY